MEEKKLGQKWPSPPYEATVQGTFIVLNSANIIKSIDFAPKCREPLLLLTKLNLVQSVNF